MKDHIKAFQLSLLVHILIVLSLLTVEHSPDNKGTGHGY